MHLIYGHSYKLSHIWWWLFWDNHETFAQAENIEEEDGTLALANATEKALQLHDANSTSLIKRTIKSGAQYFANRSYQGLDMDIDNATPEPYLIGRTGKASGYEHEKNQA